MDIKKKDIDLLTSLFWDSSQSNRQIAKEIGVSKETVASRIDHFIETGLIRGFLTKVDYSILGYKNFDILIRLKDSEIKKVYEVMDFLVKHPHSSWVGRAFGKYDIKVTMYLKEVTHINKIIEEIPHRFGGNIDLIDYIYVVDKFKASGELFLENLFNQKIDPKETFKKENEPKQIVQLDKLDRQIVYDIGQGDKKSLVELGIKYNMTAEAIKYRIKRLKDMKVINGNSITMNGNKMGKIWCLALMNVNPEKMLHMKEYLKKEKFLSNYGECVGIWNLYVFFFANSIEGLYEDLNRIRSDFHGEIRDFELMIFFEEVKFPRVPSCILEE